MPMFTGNEGEEFTLSTASEWTANYREAHPDETKAHFFGKTILANLLAQSNCVGLRMYYAIDDEDAKHLIVVGVDANGNDQTSGIIAERSSPCPTYCDSGESSLNS